MDVAISHYLFIFGHHALYKLKTFLHGLIDLEAPFVPLFWDGEEEATVNMSVLFATCITFLSQTFFSWSATAYEPPYSQQGEHTT